MNRASIQVPIDPYPQDGYGKVLDRTITIQSVHDTTKSTLIHASAESFTVAIKDGGIFGLFVHRPIGMFFSPSMD